MKKYRIKISLDGAKPPIWRRVIVPANIKLPLLHQVIQDVMGWGDSHLHQFRKDGDFYASSEFIANEKKWGFGEIYHKVYTNVRLDKLLVDVKDKLSYCYDFGDDWDHTILLEEIIDNREDKDPAPLCIKGKGACPPEDCGGIWGYHSMLEILKDTKHPEHKDLRNWLGLKRGEVYDPSYFDIDEVNRYLRGEYDDIEQAEFALIEKILNLDEQQMIQVAEIMVLESEEAARQYYLEIIKKRISENSLDARRDELMEGADFILDQIFDNLRGLEAKMEKRKNGSKKKGIVVDFPNNKVN